ncbi:MAG TPA: hypothetical protein PKM32_00595, partial [Planctomycetota bacterium]|nr:hypothetical protein [Planctomycetota bacterium]
MMEQLLSILEKKYSLVNVPEKSIPLLDQIIIHLIEEDEDPEKVKKSYLLFLKEFVDWNEVRISQLREVRQVLEPHITNNVQTKFLQIRETLSYIFTHYNKLIIENFREQEIGELKEYLKQIPNIRDDFFSKYPILCDQDLYFDMESDVANILKKLLDVQDFESIQKFFLNTKLCDFDKLFRLLKLHTVQCNAQKCNSCCISEHCQYHQSSSSTSSGKQQKKSGKEDKTLQNKKVSEMEEKKPKRTCTRKKATKQEEVVDAAIVAVEPEPEAKEATATVAEVKEAPKKTKKTTKKEQAIMQEQEAPKLDVKEEPVAEVKKTTKKAKKTTKKEEAIIQEQKETVPDVKEEPVAEVKKTTKKAKKT